MTALLWLDLETTGLDPLSDAILEVSYTFDEWSGFGARFAPPVSPLFTHTLQPTPYAGTKLFQSGGALWMHAKTGLLNDMTESKVSLGEAEQAILDLVEHYDGEIRLAGSSVHFDLQFLHTWMPELAKRLSHRVFDVTTLIEFFGVLPTIENSDQHRAAADIAWSMAVARQYREGVAS